MGTAEPALALLNRMEATLSTHIPCTQSLPSASGDAPVFMVYAKPPRTDTGKTTAAILVCFSTRKRPRDMLQVGGVVRQVRRNKKQV
jgi:hypothetical protein